jgi:hypothetical protein
MAPSDKDEGLLGDKLGPSVTQSQLDSQRLLDEAYSAATNLSPGCASTTAHSSLTLVKQSLKIYGREFEIFNSQCRQQQSVNHRAISLSHHPTSFVISIFSAIPIQKHSCHW